MAINLWQNPVFRGTHPSFGEMSPEGFAVSGFPPANMSETGSGYMIELAVPGLKKEDFQIEFRGHTLTIGCEKQEQIEERQRNYHLEEFRFSRFSRSFVLPESILPEEISAEYTDGILRIAISKKSIEKTEPAKRIEIS